MSISIQSIYNWYRDVIRNPKYRWWIIGGTLLYLLSPIDISPDFLPVIGWIDDGVIATLLVAELSQIFLERLKAGKGDNVSQAVDSQSANASNSNSTSNRDTVDVNAVSLD
ncbi:DUF1232 domain-containing protein [Kovacikia minuta CCNUW1]|uniref:YkvA family protein n=1 Tax=Kovacikia minuta TaxID=2931930 RepID=UPI001CCED9BA|nr:YkvA family protein [Kovacikia minuta]UBF25390.1 DUF1232 domain-containing protein [Kovacikia minuta CCNUW1]